MLIQALPRQLPKKKAWAEGNEQSEIETFYQIARADFPGKGSMVH